jgi:hypothetical protein
MKKLAKHLSGFVAICILILLISNCNEKKNYNTVITGQVRDFYTNSAISNVGVHILKEEIDPSSQHLQQLELLDPENWIHSVNTDMEGNFTVSFSDIESDYCKLIVYNDTIVSKESYRMRIGGTTDTVIYIKHFKPVKIHVRNLQNTYDKIYVSIEIDSDNIDFNGNLLDELGCSFNLLGFDKDTVILNRIVPDGECRIYYELFKQNNRIEYMNIHLEADNNSDTVKYELEY